MRLSVRLIPAVLISFVLAGLVGCQRRPDARAPDGLMPRLVLVIVVDQLIPEHLDPDLPGGIGRLAREGRVFTDAAHAHAFTETCPGHAVILTGVHPGRAGIPGNRFIAHADSDEGVPEVRYCVQDDGPEGVLFSPAARVDPRMLDASVASGTGRSPKHLRVDALGDWFKSSWPAARVFSVSAKDRAAITLGGQSPDAAYWLDRSGSGSFTTSRYYTEALPGWVQAWTRDRVLTGVPAFWDYGALEFGPGMREDDYVYESDRFERISPHPLRLTDASGPSLAPLEASPFLDARTLAFAKDLVAMEDLGRDETPDLLAISLSATDIVGHHYGPESREAWASLIALDAELGDFIQGLEERVGRRRLLVVLSSDHGVLPIPEWWQTHGGASAPCPVEGGRVSPVPLQELVSQALVTAFGPDWAGAWVQDGYTLGFDRRIAERDGVSLEQIAAVLELALDGAPGIERVWSRADLDEAEADDPEATLYRNSLSPDRGGDLFVQPIRGCLLTSWPAGTSHGSPYDYDRAVPLVFWGAGVEPLHVPGPAAPVDIAPSLATWIGLELPPDLDGRALTLAGKARSH